MKEEVPNPVRDRLRKQYEALVGSEGERVGRLLREFFIPNSRTTFDELSWLEQKSWMEAGTDPEMIKMLAEDRPEDARELIAQKEEELERLRKFSQ